MRDNLVKRKTGNDASCLFCLDPEGNDASCLFCLDPELVHHLFFGCCIAKLMWSQLSDICNRVIGTDFESVVGL
jgi:hypothetical protein